MINVNDYKKNYYSQNGEDGILEFLYTQIKPTGFVIEFGAADGLFCSNTAHLWRDLRCTDALLIESDPQLYEKLVSVTDGLSNVVTYNDFVTDIDSYTERVADVCSIDVDGSDYHIAYRLQTPHQIIVIEYNPTVPPHVSMIGDEDKMVGTSAKSLEYMMTGRGYTLVAVTKTNLFFLYGDHTKKFESRLEVLFDYSSLNYVVTSFEGDYQMIGEWGFGLGRPCHLKLEGRENESTKLYDTETLEKIRVMQAMYDSQIKD